MAQKRKVKRVASTGKQGAISTYSAESSWQLPAWARQFFVQNMGYIAGAFTVIMGFLAMFAAVLVFNALPLGLLGRPAVENSAGFSAVLILIQFGLLALSIKPLFAKLLKGWNYLVGAVVMRSIYHVVQGDYLAAIIFPAICLYVLLQIRHYYNE